MTLPNPRRIPRARRALIALALPALTLAAVAVPAAAAPDTGGATWTADLSTANPDSSNVATDGRTLRLGGGPAEQASARTGERTGLFVFDPHTLARPTASVEADLVGSVPTGAELAVDVRGTRIDGSWTEWVEATSGGHAVLSEATTRVQVRAVLTAPFGAAGPELRKLTLTASSSTARADLAPAARSYKVYATREGLVGGTTANGHKITNRDHFVALPSRRGLSANGSHTYSVRVCAASGRCETAPVWDIGPWNTIDDYWNPSTQRQSWRDLPQGRPEAQAAYQNGYNGGHDQFGRHVSNPAGIDLADGTFWDGLKLTDNAWVTVTYLWT
ncbi:hypothetical protein F0L68_07005 [Solihabitans fulvus]|uniref:Secreted protein n=1 Tax=Solihabitans fulvus TaxID=1892852 RepID=A0A5B2XPK2_9PSEU|nr:hypothetical protein [Solihabitans fulvus]KAA2264821.1 hypothetical protein F0L68_07005 [Solihabitans fulvus]